MSKEAEEKDKLLIEQIAEVIAPYLKEWAADEIKRFEAEPSIWHEWMKEKAPPKQG